MTYQSDSRNRFVSALTSATMVALVVLTLLWGLFFWRILTPSANDRLMFNQRSDFIPHFYAPISFQVERFWDGDLALWDPYNYGGSPLAADIQYGAFYPPRYLVAVLYGQDNWSIESYQLEIAAHYWLASVLMYAFLRVLIKRPTIALLGGVLYAYSGYLTGYALLQGSTVETEAWLPLALLGIYLSMTRPGWAIRGSLLSGLCLALSVLAGRPQAALYVIYVVVAYLLYLGYIHRTQLISLFGRIALIGGTGAGLTAIQLLPMQELATLSYRVESMSFEDKGGGFAGSELIRLVWPGLFGSWSPLYVGVVGWTLGVGALLRPRKEHAFWMGVLVIALLLSLGAHTVVYDAFYLMVPGFSMFRNQERIVSLVILALIMLAAYQLRWLLDSAGSDDTHAQRRAFTRLVYGYTGFLVIAYLVVMMARILHIAEDGTEQTANTLGFVALIGVLFAIWYAWQGTQSDRKWVIGAPLIALAVIDLFTGGMRSSNFVPDVPNNHLKAPATLQQYQMPYEDIRWRVDGAVSLQGHGTLFRIPDMYGTGPISLESVEHLYTIPVDRRWEIFSVRYASIVDAPPENVSLELLAYDVNMQGQQFEVVELLDPRPMAHLVYDARHAETSPEYARQIMADPLVDLRETAITLYPLESELPGGRPDMSRAEDFHFVTPEHMEMRVSTETNALLTISMPRYPGWRAYVDGEEVAIVDVYAGLIGVPVPAGEDQQVRIEMKSDSLRSGIWVTTLTILFVVVVAVADGLRRYRSR